MSVGARRRAGLIGVWTEKADCSCLLHAHTHRHTHTHTLAQHNPSRYLIHNTLSAWLSSFNLLFPPSPFFSDPSISNQAFSEDQRAWAWQNHLCLHRKKSYHIIVKHYYLVWRFIHVCLFSYSLGTNLSPWIELNMTNIPLWGRPNVSYIKCSVLIKWKWDILS